MEQTKIPVSIEFIKKAHSVACSDWKTKIEREYPSVFAEEVRFKIGDNIQLPKESVYHKHTYLIVGIGEDKVILANMGTGGKWSSPVKVSKVSRITSVEMDKLLDGMYTYEQISVNGKPVNAPLEKDVVLYAKKEMILQAYEAASSDTKKMIMDEFPDLFKSEYVKFGSEFKISTSGQSIDGVHFIVGDGLAPRPELELSCIAVDNRDCEVVVEHDGIFSYIYFKKKR
jgi:hypothetical protein